MSCALAQTFIDNIKKKAPPSSQSSPAHQEEQALKADCPNTSESVDLKKHSSTKAMQTELNKTDAHGHASDHEHKENEIGQSVECKLLNTAAIQSGTQNSVQDTNTHVPIWDTMPCKTESVVHDNKNGTTESEENFETEIGNTQGFNAENTNKVHANTQGQFDDANKVDHYVHNQHHELLVIQHV